MTEALWAAVDAITKPTKKAIVRDARQEWLVELDEFGQGSFCRVEDYRAAVGNVGTVPSLWEQAHMALHKTGETDSGNRSHLATRSPADVALMETMLSIRELIGQQFIYWVNIKTPLVDPPKADVPGQLRQMASHIITHFPAEVDWWAKCIAQWQRLLETYLQAVETGPKPMRLRYRCPDCKTEYLYIPDPDGGRTKTGEIQKLQIRPIVAVYRDDWFRCFQCEACSLAWWGDSGVHELNRAIKADEAERKEKQLLEEMTG